MGLLGAISLKSDIQDILDHHASDDAESPEDTDTFAESLTDAIVDYLDDVQIDYPKAPGVSAAPPYTDPSFSSGNMDPIVSPSSLSSVLEAGIKASIAASDLDSASASNWAAADSAFAALLVAAGIVWQSSDGYIATGATVAAVPVGFDSSWDVGLNGGSTADVAFDLATRVHAATIAAIFTGAYLKAAFIGPGPHVSTLS